jgi:putative ABC transport system permease protein
MSSISLGAAALVAIDSFAANMTASVREQARALLGGDVSLTAREPLPAHVEQLVDSLASNGVGVTEVTGFASMALVPRSGLTRLASVRAVGEGYPFYGEITTEPAGRWGDLQQGRHAIVDPSLLVSLDAHLGDSLALGTGHFLIVGAIKDVPGEPGIAASIGPRVYIPNRYLGETGLLVFGSRAEYETLFRLPPELSTPRFVARFNKRLTGDRIRLRTVAENEYNLTESIEQLRDFLGIVGLIALLLGGIGVASGVHAFVTRKIDTVAVLRCLGATSRQVLAVYVLQAAAMGLVGALAGAALGIALQFALPAVVSDFLPVDVRVSDSGSESGSRSCSPCAHWSLSAASHRCRPFGARRTAMRCDAPDAILPGSSSVRPSSRASSPLASAVPARCATACGSASASARRSACCG